jgi:hypothetical protein
MTISVVEGETETTLAVAGAADLREAGPLRAALVECLDKERPAVLSLVDLDAVDVALLQLVWSARRAFAADSVPFRVVEGEAARKARTTAGLPPCDEA